MKKKLLVALILIMNSSFFNLTYSLSPFYELSAIDISGKSFSFGQLKGKKGDDC